MTTFTKAAATAAAGLTLVSMARRRRSPSRATRTTSGPRSSSSRSSARAAPRSTPAPTPRARSSTTRPAATRPAIFRVPAAGGAQRTVLGGGPLRRPEGLAVSNDGKRLYVADTRAGHILVVPVSGAKPHVLRGTAGTSPRGLEIQTRGGKELVVYTGRAATAAPPCCASARAAPRGRRVVSRARRCSAPTASRSREPGRSTSPTTPLGGRALRIDGSKVTTVAGAIRLGASRRHRADARRDAPAHLVAQQGDGHGAGRHRRPGERRDEHVRRRHRRQQERRRPAPRPRGGADGLGRRPAPRPDLPRRPLTRDRRRAAAGLAAGGEARLSRGLSPGPARRAATTRAWMPLAPWPARLFVVSFVGAIADLRRAEHRGVAVHELAAVLARAPRDRDGLDGHERRCPRPRDADPLRRASRSPTATSSRSCRRTSGCRPSGRRRRAAAWARLVRRHGGSAAGGLRLYATSARHAPAHRPAHAGEARPRACAGPAPTAGRARRRGTRRRAPPRRPALPAGRAGAGWASGDPRQLAALRIGLCAVLVAAARAAGRDVYLSLAEQEPELYRPLSFMALADQMPPRAVDRGVPRRRDRRGAARRRWASPRGRRWRSRSSRRCLLNGMYTAQGKVMHNDVLLVLCLLAIVFARHGDAWSLDARRRGAAANAGASGLRLAGAGRRCSPSRSGTSSPGCTRSPGPAGWVGRRATTCAGCCTSPPTTRADNGAALWIAEHREPRTLGAYGLLATECLFFIVLFAPRPALGLRPGRASRCTPGTWITLRLDYSAWPLCVLVVFVTWPAWWSACAARERCPRAPAVKPKVEGSP